MSYQYQIGKGDDKIVIISHTPAHKEKEKELVFPYDFHITYGNKTLMYYEGFGLKEKYTAKSYPGRESQHIFEIKKGKIKIELTSKDQKTFYLKIS